MIDLSSRLDQFEPVNLQEEPGSVDSSFADRFLKVFTRMAKAQWKTEQKADHAASKVADYLDEHGDLLDDLKRQRADLEERNEQLERFILEVVDLITGFRKTAQQSNNSEMESTAKTMAQALEKHMANIGLQRIPAVGETPDSMYHFVVGTTEPERPEQKDRVVEVVEEGYTLKGEVVRKANVIVGK